VENLRALEGAASSLGLRRTALLMLDLGDGREGAPLDELPELLEQIARERFTHVELNGLGATLGCLQGTPPHRENMAALGEAARLAEDRLGRPPALVSLGGSVCLEWLTRHPGCPSLPAGCILELRAGDPLFLGYDMYRDAPFPEGAFRDDIFQLRAAVLEVKKKEFHPLPHQVLNGRGEAPPARKEGRCIRVLLDCGSLHTRVDDLKLELPEARVVGYSANYTVLDMPLEATPPLLGGMVSFRAGYWAVAGCFRSPAVSKRCLGCNAGEYS
jgi:predicted amino acid racemase